MNANRTFLFLVGLILAGLGMDIVHETIVDARGTRFGEDGLIEAAPGVPAFRTSPPPLRTLDESTECVPPPEPAPRVSVR